MSTITIPVNALAIQKEDRQQTKVRVAVKAGNEVHSQVISIADGKGEARFEIEGSGQVAVAVGPEATSAADLFNKATPGTSISPTTVNGKLVYSAQPIVITEAIWRLWLIWCRKFTISGYVYAPDGNPVPSAEVTAFNVDWFWWWSSTTPVGSAVTDPTGHFTITFEWCCGWLPFYWWELRDWRLDPVLVDKINSVLELNRQLRVSAPSVTPVLGFTELNPQPLPPRAASAQVRFLQSDFTPQGHASGARVVAPPVAVNPATLPGLREKLLTSLPSVPEFERFFCLWPWCPWWPWLDCDPNIIFKVTQSCGGLSKIILDETVWQARQNIPTELNVTLTTNADACTIPPGPGQPEGDCFLFTVACDVPASDIGLTCATDDLNGLAFPELSDRPFTGSVSLWGQFGTSAQADYYAITYRPLQACSPPSSVPFEPVPPAALAAFQRIYFDATQPYPNQWFYPDFPPQTKAVSGGGTATVYESRQFYQTENDVPPNWGNVMSGRSWTYNVDTIAVIDTDGFFTDGVYEFQVVGYTANADGSLELVGPLAGCGKPSPAGLNDNNDFALRFANPTSPAETVPSAVISSLVFTVSGSKVTLPACGILTVKDGEILQSLDITFTASDAEGFLDEYYFTLQWGSNAPTVIGASASGPPAPGDGLLSTTTPGVELGPTYAQAVAQGAIRPNWSGGQYTLSIPDATPLFPESCAYELQLNVYKRNIVNCDEDDYYWEPAYYSFTVLFST
jgi:hypothetical protein